MRALILMHDHVTEPGLIGSRLTERGYDLTTVTVVPEDRYGEPNVRFAFPDADGWDLIVSLGAPWSVYDETAVGHWIEGELALLRKAHHSGVPLLGVCFGAQALTTALGGSVEPAPHPEIGWYRIDTADPSLVPDGPWFQWHFDRCVMPPGAVRVAHNELCTQAYQVGRSLAVQFHPEITASVVGRYLEHDGREQCLQHGVDPDELLAQSRAAEAAARDNTNRLVDTFLDRMSDVS